MTIESRAEQWLRLYNLIANLAHPKDDHRGNPLEDEAHDLIRELRAEGSSAASPRDDMPLRDMMMPEAFYQSLDVGIRFAVRVLHAGAIETCQSCEGGHGHAYDRPTVDLIARGDDAIGFRALAALVDYGLPVADLSIVWNIRHGLPYEKLWRVTFTTTMQDRADEAPTFVHGYRAPAGDLRPQHDEKHILP